MVFGNVPAPAIEARILNKPEGAGWDDRGPRNIVGVCVHRMLGTLKSTHDHFSRSDVGALTDFGIGGVMDPGRDGAIWQWNPLSGNRTPWASGWDPWDDPNVVVKSHGREFFDTWRLRGYDLNRDLASIELSGCTAEQVQVAVGVWQDATWCGAEETPVTPAQIESLAHLIAYVCDRYCRISHEDFPFNPAVGPGFYAVYQHFEFSGKNCPFPALKVLHATYVARAREILRQYQTDWAPPFVPFGMVRVFTVRHDVHASGRQAPSSAARWVRGFGPMEAVECDGVYFGEAVQGDQRWLRTADPEHLAIHASAFIETI